VMGIPELDLLLEHPTMFLASRTQPISLNYG